MKDLREWLEYFPFPLVIVNSDGSIKHCNTFFSDLTDQAAAGTKIKDLFHQWEVRGQNVVSAKIADHPYVLLYNRILHENEELFLYVTADGTHLQVLERTVTELNKELDAIMESSDDVIYITNREGKTLKTNSAIERFTGLPKECFVGKNVKELVQKGILKESMTHKVLQQGKAVYSIPPVNPAGKDTLKTAIPIFDEAGKIEKVVTYVRDLTELNRLHRELKKALDLNNEYKQELEKLKTKTCQDPNLIVESKKMADIYEMADRIADVDATVLILGETGVGKDVLARYIYHASKRRKTGKFIKINCGAIPHELLESELFGYEPGAFTGASPAGKPGMFELADQGVLFLDEVGELPMALQVKLLRVLQEKQIQRIGGTKSIKADVRLIAATNRDLKQMVKHGEFREDLFYRLHVIPIHIPPLRERKEDILPLVRYFLHSLNEKYQLCKQFSQCLKEFFYHYHWPGNVRELSNLVERLILTVPHKIVTVKDLPDEYKDSKEPANTFTQAKTLKEAVEIAEREILALAVQKFNSTYKIAEELGTSQPTIVRKLKKYKLSTMHERVEG